MKQRYQGRWDENMMADYCWKLKRDLPQEKEKCCYEYLSNPEECVIIRINICSLVESQWYAEPYIKPTSSKDYLING